MLCTPAEIEEKKRRAKEKLLQKRRPVSSSSIAVSPSSAKHFPFERVQTEPAGRTSSFNSPTRKRRFQEYLQQNAPNQQPATTSTSTSPSITATFVLTTPTRFEVRLSKYCNIAIDVMRAIPSKSYDPKTTNWSFALDDYDLMLRNLEPLKSELAIIKLPIWIHQLKQPKLNDQVSCYDFSAIDEELRDTLMPFQEEGLCFGIDRQGKCFIADEMGLGKTLQALAIAAYYRADWPVLIVSTASTCPSWPTTIFKYLPSVLTLSVQHLTSKNDYLDAPSFIITSYDMMARRADDLLATKCGVCIFDESHTLKNFKTKLFTVARSLAKCARRVVLLSGTPALSRPSELYTQLQLIDETFFVSFTEYSKRYCNGRESAYGWDASGQSHLDELRVVLEQRFLIRRTKAGMSSLALPDKRQELVELDLDMAQLDAEERRHWEHLQGTDFHAVIKNEREILPFFRSTGRLKIPAVCAYVAKLLREQTDDKEEGCKFLVFAHHTIMLDALERIVRDAGADYIRIDGRSAHREQLVHRFQSDARVRCALLSITAANSGITLTAARAVIFAELHWTPSILAQAEARAHRIGQTHAVTVRYLLARRTVDDYIWPMLQRKQRTLQHMKLTTDTLENFSSVKQVVTPSAVTGIRKYFTPSPKAAPLPNKELCSELDDGDDELFANFATQCEPAVANSSADLFDDDFDELLKQLPLEM